MDKISLKYPSNKGLSIDSNPNKKDKPPCATAQITRSNFDLPSFNHFSGAIYNLKNTPSFRGIDSFPKIKNISELNLLLSQSKKYTEKEVEDIIKSVQNVFDADEFDEINGELLYNSVISLAQSNKNSSADSIISVMNLLTEFKSDPDNEYIDINNLFALINMAADKVNVSDYRFKSLFTGNGEGILSCEDSSSVQEFFDFINKKITNADENKIFDILKSCSIRVNGNSNELQDMLNSFNLLDEKYGLSGDNLPDAIRRLYRVPGKKSSVEEVMEYLNMKSTFNAIHNKLQVSSKPDKEFFEKVFERPIKILIKRGYLPDDIAKFLSIEDYCNKIILIENINYADPQIMADFIENIPNILGCYEVFEEYTKGSGKYNNSLVQAYNEKNGNKVFRDEEGIAYTEREAKDSRIMLYSILKKQSLPRDMTLYRGSDNKILNQIQMSDGENIGDAIDKAIENSDTKRLEEITSELVGTYVTSDRFLSTSYARNRAKSFTKTTGGILWKISVPKGTQGIYADPFNKIHGPENEILINKGYSLIINDAKYKDNIMILSAQLFKSDEQD